MITTKDILEEMKTGNIFSCRVVTYDRKRKTGGKILEIHQAVLVQKEERDRPMTNIEQKQLQKKRGANHRKHYTRNIKLCVDGIPTEQIVKIHPPLILEFNGKDVL